MKPILVKLKILGDERKYYWVNTVCGARDVLAILVDENGDVIMAATENVKVQMGSFKTE